MLRRIAAALGGASGEMRWAFSVSRDTDPGLYGAMWLNSLVAMICPAGLAISVRGLVNVVSAELSGSSSGATTEIYWWLGLGLAMTFGTVVTGTMSRYLRVRFEIELGHRLNLEIHGLAGAMPCPYLESGAFQDSFRRAKDSPERHVSNLLAHSFDLLTKLVQAGSLVAILVIIEPLLFILLLPIALPYLVFRWRLSRRQFDEVDARIQKRRWIDYYAGLVGSQEGAAEIKLLGLGDLLVGRMRRIMDEYRDLLLRHQRFELIGTLAFALLSVLAVYTAMTRAATSILGGGLTIGDLAIYTGAAAQLRMLVDQGIGLIAASRWEVLHVRNLRSFLATEIAAPIASGHGAIELSGAVEFRDVGFGYPGAKSTVLDGVSFSIAAGETVAIVGDNGAGKTTVAKLLSRLYEPSRGSILFDGVDARSLEVAGVRNQIACVFQNFGRYAATAADNIAFGAWQRLLDDGEEVAAIARRAGVDPMVQSLPEKYDTMLGRAFGAVELSGGQWQQLAIARAMARNAKILIFDEPTSNLDVETEYEVFQRFRELAHGKTALLISHRFSTVSMADRILMLEGGRVTESGTHAQLIERGGRYASLYRLHRRHLTEP